MVTMLVLGLLAAVGQATVVQGDSAADALLRESVDIMGGDRLRALETVRWTGMASDELPGISAWGTPTVGMFRAFTELRDLGALSFRRESTVVLPQRPAPLVFTEIVTPQAAAQVVADRVTPGSPTQLVEGQTSLAYGPERALLTALAAHDARIGTDTTIGGVVHHTVRFDRGRVAVYIGADSKLLGGVAVTQAFPADQTWGMWGDVTTLTVFAAWSYVPGGLRLPHQLTVFRNGRPLRRVVLREVALGVVAPADSFPVNDALIAQFRVRGEVTLGVGEDAPREMAPGVVLIPGPFNVVLVAQADGVVVIGAPRSAAYSALVLAEVARRFPGIPVKAVVAASGTWPHLAGVRAFVARGIPVYAAAASAAVIRAVVRSPHALLPDSLARAPRTLVLNEVRQPLTLGSGERRIELYPNVGAGVAHPDQVAVYLPGHALLFGADLYRPPRFEPNLWRQPLGELVALLRESRLEPRTVLAFHIGPTPWAEVLAAWTVEKD